MLSIVAPSAERIEALQNEEARYYWSAGAVSQFRRHGVLSVVETTAEATAGTLPVYLRGTAPDVATLPDAFVLEGPIPGNLAGRLGLTAELHEGDRVVLLDSAEESVGLAFDPSVRVRGAATGRVELTLDSTREYWRPRPVKSQSLAGDGWETLAWFRDEDGDVPRPMAVRRGPCLVFGLPIFDLLSRWSAFVPLDERYGGLTGFCPSDRLASWMVSLVLDCARRAGAEPIVRVRRWPDGFDAALTIRHDYDRVCEDDDLEGLLDAYDRVGVSASVGFIPHLLIEPHLRRFRDRGHEIQIHVASGNEHEFRRELDRLNQAYGRRVTGATVHGGPRGLGFRGDLHYTWFERAGLLYTESIGVPEGISVPIMRPYDGVPAASGLLGTQRHSSMDGSTRPDHHMLANLKKALPALLDRGSHAIVMNHPDIHQAQMIELVSGLALEGVWCATLDDVARWHRATHYASVLDVRSGAGLVTFGDSVRLSGTMNVETRRESRRVNFGAGCEAVQLGLDRGV